LLGPILLGGKIVESYSVRRENLMPVTSLQMVQLVKWNSSFVVLVPIFRLTSNSWVSNRRAAGLC
jgi:uncharacterized protein with ACT and thioredoxin-like domain